MRTRLAAVGVIVVAIAAIVAVALSRSSGATRAHGPARYYLALGDSLSQGMEPNTAGVTVNTRNGYTDKLYALEARRIPGLRLVKLGCGGENTFSMLSGRSNGLAPVLGCRPAGGAQIVAAERFLRAHARPGEVPLVTLDIGGNDLVGCTTSTPVEAACLAKGLQHVEAELPPIVRRLRGAAGPGVTLAGMTLYNPFLAAYLTPERRAEALLINESTARVNHALERIYRSAGFRVARVDDAFHTYDTSLTAAPGTGQPVPVAVAEICRLTWMCAASPRGGNDHANPTGYGVIAAAFAAAVGRLR